MNKLHDFEQKIVKWGVIKNGIWCKKYWIFGKWSKMSIILRNFIRKSVKERACIWKPMHAFLILRKLLFISFSIRLLVQPSVTLFKKVVKYTFLTSSISPKHHFSLAVMLAKYIGIFWFGQIESIFLIKIKLRKSYERFYRA